MKSISKAIAGSLLMLGFTLASAAQAGTAYVPLPGVGAVGGVTYTPQISIANPEGERQVLESLQLAPGVDGTQREGLAARRLSLLPGKTLVLRPEAGSRGLLELKGAQGLHYSARLVGSNGDRVELPVITSENRGREDETLTLLGLEGSATRSTRLVILNLGDGVASCSASLIRADGTYAVEPVEVELRPLSHQVFSDLFRGFPAGISEAHAEVSCSNDFYAYAEIADAATGRLEIVGPAQAGDVPTSSIDALLKSTVSCGTGRKICELLGLVHTSTKANPTVSISMVPPVGTYKSMRAHVEVQVNGWNKANVRGAHGMLYVVVNRNKSLLGNVFLRGPGGDKVTLRHGVCPNGCTKSKVEKPLKATLGQTYMVDYLYDVGNKRTDMRITLNGQLVAQINDQPNVKNIFIEPKDQVIIGLSNPFTNSREEPASLTWTYSNLRVEFFQ